MTKKLYIDGCSYTFGLGLERHETLQHLFEERGMYDVINNSRPGKSNLAIAIDTFNHAKNCDLAIIGWSYAARFYLKYRNDHIDFLATRNQIEIPNGNLDNNEVEKTYQDFHKNLYSLYDDEYFDNLSDMLISNTYHSLISQGKKVLFFSWERRKTDCYIYYPHIAPKFRLPDGHLNADGTTYLYNNLQNILNE